MTRTRYWRELKSTEVPAVDRESTVLVLPLAAVEQHGPHLPLDTDLRIGEGLLAEAARRAPDDLGFLVLPAQPIGYSAEHEAFSGTLTLPPETLLHLWTALGAQVSRLGFRRLVLFNSHGGNSDLIRIAVRELRMNCHMLAVAASWYRLADLDGLVDADELAHGIHGGTVETSVMLHLAPALVDMEAARDFPSAAARLAERNTHLSATGKVQFGWATQDLNMAGAVGDASAATAELGAKIVDRAVDGLLALLRETAEFDLAGLRPTGR